MGKFKGDRWHIYFNEESKQRREEIIDHLQENYDGPSDFVHQKLEQESALGIEERIERTKSKEKEYKEKRQRLERIREERQQQTALRDKKELLKQKQKRLDELDNSGLTYHQALCNAVDKMAERSSTKSLSEVEYVKAKWGRIQRMAESKLSSCDVDQLVSDVQRLQGEIKELNNGDALDCFKDLEAVEARQQ